MSADRIVEQLDGLTARLAEATAESDISYLAGQIAILEELRVRTTTDAESAPVAEATPADNAANKEFWREIYSYEMLTAIYDAGRHPKNAVRLEGISPKSAKLTFADGHTITVVRAG